MIGRQATPIVSYAAVEGRIQTLSNRGSLRFTLYDTLYDRAVSCYLAEGQEELIRDARGHRAIIEGRLTRDPVSGRPLTVREITNLEVLPETPEGSYRSARGAIRIGPDAPLPEEVIRGIRDAE